MFAEAETGGGSGRGAAARLVAVIAVIAIIIIAAAALTPTRAAPPGQGNAAVSGLEIVSDPLLSGQLSAIVLAMPALLLSGGNLEAVAPHTSYAATDVITVDVSFNQPVLLFTYGDSPTQSLMLNIGGTEKAAWYMGKVDGNDRVHRFSYVVGGSDRDNDGLSIAANALRLHHSWFVRASDAFCDARMGGPILGPTLREPDCHDYAINLALTGYTVDNDHRHRVRAQTPEATRNLTGRRVTDDGPAHILLNWEYSSLVSDNAPARFLITWRVMNNGIAAGEGKFKVEGSARQTKDLVGAQRMGDGTLHYTIAGENSHGLGYSPTVIVSR